MLIAKRAVEIKLEKLWEKVLEILQVELSRPTFETWIKTASPEQLENDCLIIRTPNPFARNWLQKYYLKTIADAAGEILGRRVEIYLTTAGGNENSGNGDVSMVWPSPRTLKASETAGNREALPSNLNPKYMFSRFVVGPNNRMAHAASLAVAEYPGREFNPLFQIGRAHV